MNKLIHVIFFGLLSACSTTTPDYDAKFGDAVREARIRMTINPEAGKNPDPVTGMDGQAAQEAMDRYQGSFKEPPPVTNVINIGGGVNAGK